MYGLCSKLVCLFAMLASLSIQEDNSLQRNLPIACKLRNRNVLYYRPQG